MGGGQVLDRRLGALVKGKLERNSMTMCHLKVAIISISWQLINHARTLLLAFRMILNLLREVQEGKHQELSHTSQIK